MRRGLALRLSDVTQSEAEVLRDVRRFVAAHPRVARLIRINSGVAKIGDEGRLVRFCEIEGQARVRHASRRSAAIAAAAAELEELVPDLIGIMADGRFLAIECKRGGWRKPITPRERAQERFLAAVRNAGGVAGFVASLREAQELLDD